MKKKNVSKECGVMPTATLVPKSISSLKALEEKFDKILSENQDLINKITPFNPVISKDDEWNDPIYDSFAQIDKNGDEDQ